MAVIELGDGWQARPLKGFRCWQLYERVDTDPKTGDPLDELRWRALECYPSTLALAVRFAAERGLKAAPGSMALDEAVDRLERFADSVREVG